MFTKKSCTIILTFWFTFERIFPESDSGEFLYNYRQRISLFDLSKREERKVNLSVMTLFFFSFLFLINFYYVFSYVYDMNKMKLLPINFESLTHWMYRYNYQIWSMIGPLNQVFFFFWIGLLLNHCEQNRPTWISSAVIFIEDGSIISVKL